MTAADLKGLSPRFELYSHTGRPSVPPEKLLLALLLQIPYLVRSELLLMEEEYNLLFRWGCRSMIRCRHPASSRRTAIVCRRGCCGGVLRGRLGSGPGRAVALGLAFHRGRHVAGRGGQFEELSAERRGGAAVRRGRVAPRPAEEPTAAAPAAPRAGRRAAQAVAATDRRGPNGRTSPPAAGRAAQQFEPALDRWRPTTAASCPPG